MTPKWMRRVIPAIVVAGLLGPGLALPGPLLGAGWWWEKHFEGEGYSPLHYWLPGAYRCRAYLHPVQFNEPLQPFPPPTVPPGQDYPFSQLPPVMPPTEEMKKTPFGQLPPPDMPPPSELKKDR